MNNTIRDAVIMLAKQLQKDHPEYRYGQAIFNAVHILRPATASEYAGSRIDPFYNDKNVDTFLEVIEMKE